MSTTAPARLSRPAAPTDRVSRETARLLASDLSRLNFGCGPFPLNGWTNIDNGDGEWYAAPDAAQVIRLDIFEALQALPDAVASYIYSEHVFEHFTLEQGHRILREWSRVLRPGGVVRIVCPDLEAEARLFLRQIAPAPDEIIDRHRRRWLGDRYRFQEGERLTRAMVLNYGMWLDGHKFVYDQTTLAQSLSLAGYESITRTAFGVSEHPDLNALDSHDGGETGQGWIPALALVMEGTRPAGARPTTLSRPAPAFVAERKQGSAPPIDRVAALQRRLIEVTAQLCAARGYRRIALYGAGRHTAPIVREPWSAHGVTVAAVLDDAPKVGEVGGIRVCTPTALVEKIDAVVVSSDAHEAAIASRAERHFGPRGVPVVRIYGDGLSPQV